MSWAVKYIYIFYVPEWKCSRRKVLVWLKMEKQAREAISSFYLLTPKTPSLLITNSQDRPGKCGAKTT